MDRKCDKICRDKKFKELDRQESINDLLRGFVEKLSSLIKRSFSKIGKTQRDKCKQASYLNIDLINMLSSQKHLSTKTMQSNRSKTHTHTHTKQVYPILYFKNKSRQFSEHILTHVSLVMAKSHCTCTCIKSSKEFCVLCVKNIARLHKRLML